MPARFLLPAVLLLSIGLLPNLGRAAAEPAPAPSAEALLTLTSEAGKTIRLTAADLEKLPHQKVQAADPGQDAVDYEGVPLSEVLKLAGAPLGDALGHGDAPSWYVAVEAKDNYRALFSLAELDPAFADRVVLLADRKAGKPFAENEGRCGSSSPERSGTPAGCGR
jgi:hypothetical protein